MADAVVSALLQVVFDRLASPVLEKLHDLSGLKENFEKLRRSLPMIQAFLEDAEEKQVEDKYVKTWLLKLKDVAYDSDDLLDELAAEIILCESRYSIGGQLPSLFLTFEPSRRLFNIAFALKNMLLVLDKITTEGLSLNLKEKLSKGPSECLTRNRETGSFVIEREIYGREKDKEKILDFLLHSCHGLNTGDISILPIVGIAGIGKTTLAQLVYNDTNFMGFFDIKLWVHVSSDFDIKKLIKATIESATMGKNTVDVSHMDMLQYHLRQSLCGKRFMLVLDDLWNEDPEEWCRFIDLLRSGVEGSKIMVTTRSKKVASIVGTTSPYCLEGMHEVDCFKLFKQRAFGPGEEGKHPNLLSIGKQIVKKCGGVPLAAKTLGSLLRLKREERDWLFVQESELCKVDDIQSGILPTLKLSYIHLPAHLKRCFAYCSLFPKNYEIKKEKLIHLWMAEGLIQADEGYRQLEDIGDGYFNDLVWMSFLQEAKKMDNDSTAGYKMHDLIHELAQSVSSNEFLRLEHGPIPIDLTRMRHSSIVCNTESSAIPLVLQKATRLRTLLLLTTTVICEELPSFLTTKFTNLRVLDICGSGIKKLHKSIDDLICLRYLDLSNTSIRALPDTICNLCNLQTLNLSGCHRLVKLPGRMNKLISLRHINLNFCESLTHIPSGIGELMHLQTCSIYIVGKMEGESIAELSHLNLRGELNIKCLENVRDEKEAKMANLEKKQHLHMLGLLWGGNEGLSKMSAEGRNLPEVKDIKNRHSTEPSHRYYGGAGGGGSGEVEAILEGLKPHRNLQKLFIKGYNGVKFPLWFLPNLTAMVLINCKSCVYLPTLGQLPCLKTLYLQGLSKVKLISREFYADDIQKPFPSLKELTIRDFPNLDEWFGIEDKEPFVCLEKLHINNCPNLKAAPFFPSLHHLELRGCHPSIVNSLEKVSTLSILVIDSFPDMVLSGELLRNNHFLTSLKISSCPNIRSLPLQLENLTALKSLTISWCEELSSLPQGLQNFKSLESLVISECHGLTSLPEDGIGGLSSLKVLSIENCNNLTSLSNGLQNLIALEHLTIMYCPKLVSLPNNFSNLLALRSLSILCCPELVSLPEGLQHVTALHSLELRSCPALKELPDWNIYSSLRSLSLSDCQNLTSLPEELLCLSKLQHLSIHDCPMLEKSLKQKRGWTGISPIYLRS